MSDKKERKRLGAQWKALSEEEQVRNGVPNGNPKCCLKKFLFTSKIVISQAPWNDKLAIIREEYEKEEIAYEEKLEAWREEKLKR